ncbi:hypothetical protein [Nocardia noduli]|uniref:hypothetical protein n=1 Tax=Nocardia noduli TaxID=2815722 RepID=UPI001C21C59D|nr:hypothetical protein [Nocardia noduli]
MALKRAAGISLEAATAIKGVVRNLRTSLDLEDDATNFPWGKDSFGKKFSEGANGYKTSRNTLLEGGEGLGNGAQGFADGQGQAADLMIASDEA